MSRDIVKVGGVGEHGMGFKGERDGVMSRKEGMPKSFHSVAESVTKFPSLLGEECLFCVAK